MILDSHLSSIPVFLRSRNYQWYWNCAVDPWSIDDEQWQKYSDIENEIIEDANNEKKFIIEIDGNYIINLECLLQYKKGNDLTTCPIKRVQFDKNKNNIYRREERFLFPVSFITSVSSCQQLQNENELDLMRIYGYITSLYWKLELENTNKTIFDVIEDAAYGIIIEGSIVDKIYEAQWLSKQLESVKDFGSNVKVNSITKFPSEIGQICVYLYTKESFLYKLINHVLRNPHSLTHEHVKNLGPFCWLLDWYLYDNPTTNILTVYRSLNINDEQRKLYMEPIMKFTSFTSTSRNREVAEFYNGNTLLIIDLNVRDNDHKYIQCGRDISSLSDFPEEEEFLIWPGRDFIFVKYEYDSGKNKHIIYLKSSNWDI